MSDWDLDDHVPVKTTPLEWGLIVALIVAVVLYFSGVAA